MDSLVAQGVDKVILLAHMQQISVEKALAFRLMGVEIIVAGGSNTILADANDRLRPGDEAEDTYPLRFDSPTGEPVLLVNTDADYRYLGRLIVGFNDQGVVIPDSVDPSISGAYATDEQGGRESGGQPIAEVSRIADSLAEYLAHFHVDTSYNVLETPPLDDESIQNLAIPGKQDTVFSPR